MKKRLFSIQNIFLQKNEDFTIIYRGKEEDENHNFHEIKTSKDELMRKLRYFKRKAIELNYTDEIYIHENVSFEIFKEFINSILNKKLKINEKNYSSIYELSKKYEYYELQKQVENFMQTRPDLKQASYHFSYHKSDSNDDSKNSEEEEKDETYKEELISKNLDFCLQNHFLNEIPLYILIRILNSPKRVLKNHNFLFKFVIETIKKYNDESVANEEKEIVQMLPSCLNYSKMTSNEIKELISVTKSSIFIPKNSSELIQSLILEIDEMKEKMQNLDSKYSEIKQKIEKYDELNEKNQKEMTNKFLKQEEINKNQESKITSLKQIIEKYDELNEKNKKEMTNKFLKQEEINKNQGSKITNLKRIIEKHQQILQELTEKVQQQDEIIKKHESFNQEMVKIIEENENRIQKMKKIEILYTPGNEFNGIIDYLRKESGGVKNKINISSSSINGSRYKPENAINFNDDCVFESGKEDSPWFCIDFKDHQIIPKHYSIRSGDWGKDFWHPKSWVIEGKNIEDSDFWEILDEHENCPILNGHRIVHTFNIQNIDKPFRYIRIRQTGINWDTKPGSQKVLVFDSIEFFGTLL